MAIELRVMLRETDTGDTGWTVTELDSEAWRLTPASFQQRYAMPAIAAAWMQFAESVKQRRTRGTQHGDAAHQAEP